MRYTIYSADALGTKLSDAAASFEGVNADFYRGWLYLYGGLPRG